MRGPENCDAGTNLRGYAKKERNVRGSQALLLSCGQRIMEEERKNVREGMEEERKKGRKKERKKGRKKTNEK